MHAIVLVPGLGVAISIGAVVYAYWLFARLMFPLSAKKTENPFANRSLNQTAGKKFATAGQPSYTIETLRARNSQSCPADATITERPQPPLR
jgi:hypothetical protein